MTKETAHNYRPDIDGLRALAVLLVLGYHIYPKIVKGGFVGVDIFFVISGFLITGIILNGLKANKFSLKTFFARRVKRIFPVLFLVMASTYVAGWFLLLPKEFMELNKHIMGGVGFVANFTLWHDSGYFDALPELKPLLHLWSLSIEEQFYLLWPLCLMVVWKYSLRIKPFLLSAISLSFLLNVIFVSKKTDMVFYFPVFRFWEILIGAALTIYLYEKTIKIDLKKQNYLSFLGLLFIIAANLLLTKYSTFPGWWALLPTIGTMLIILCKDAWLNTHFFSNKIAVTIGLISYPLYLWHWPIISFMYIKFQNLPYQMDRIIIIVLSFFLAWVSYRFIETPIRHGKNTKTIVATLCFLSLFLGAVGFITYKMNGVPQRISKALENEGMPPDLQEMLIPDFGGHISKEWREHRCFLAKEENASQYKDECLEKTRPLVFLWGDSHAAVLYKGLKDYQEKKSFGIAQFNVSACPPIFNYEVLINKFCRKINDHILEEVKKVKPEIVVLSAAWYWSEYEWEKVISTITELKTIGIKKIVIMGPVPNWREKVPANIISYYRKFQKLPPQYTEFGLDVEEIRKLDTQLEEFSRVHGVNYISIYKTLCTTDGCMLSVGDSIKNITSLDQGHLSVHAARFVIESNAKVLFE